MGASLGVGTGTSLKLTGSGHSQKEPVTTGSGVGSGFATLTDSRDSGPTDGRARRSAGLLRVQHRSRLPETGSEDQRVQGRRRQQLRSCLQLVRQDHKQVLPPGTP